jgi:hypothetical protein
LGFVVPPHGDDGDDEADDQREEHACQDAENRESCRVGVRTVSVQILHAQASPSADRFHTKSLATQNPRTDAPQPLNSKHSDDEAEGGREEHTREDAEDSEQAATSRSGS